MTKVDFTPDCAAVQKYLEFLQASISRMSASSSTSKNWCITVVSGISIAALSSKSPHHVLLGLFPMFLFMFLDVSYLALERGYREMYDRFVEGLATSEAKRVDLFVMKLPIRHSFLDLLGALRSWSVWPFYVLITISICVLPCLV